MRKLAGATLQIEELVLGGQAILRIHITAAALKDWALSLQLLQDELVDSIRFGSVGSGKHIEIRRSAIDSSSISHPAGDPRIEFEAHSLEFVRHFFLRYYRDGMAEVNHLDIELQGGHCLTITVDEYAPAVSADEMRLRLGLDPE